MGMFLMVDIDTVVIIVLEDLMDYGDVFDGWQ
jgi:hypothetical protein